MKILICAEDVERLAAEGQNSIVVDNNTIVTPAAKDAAKKAGMTLSYGAQAPSSLLTGGVGLPQGRDAELIFQVLRELKQHGLLEKLFSTALPFQQETLAGGVRLIRGESIQYQKIDTDNPNNNVRCRELISKAQEGISAGMLKAEHSDFKWTAKTKEVYLVEDGSLTLEINGEQLCAAAGDLIHLPCHTTLRWIVKEPTTLFYVRH